MSDDKIVKLSRAVSTTYSYVTTPGPGIVSRDGPLVDFGNYQEMQPWRLPWQMLTPPVNYAQELFQCRYFYRRDPFASTVINRMSEMTAGKLQNRKDHCTDEEYYYFNAVAERLEQLIRDAALEYFISGMAIPDYYTTRVMGKKLHSKLGRTRYVVPDPIWIRNTDNIELKRKPIGADRMVYLKIPESERAFILSGGTWLDGTVDTELYKTIVRQFPEYVQSIKNGATRIPMPQITPILRKPLPTADYPQPFLTATLDSLKHKLKIKEMDYTIASRAIEAVLLIKAGSDEFPVTEDDPTLVDLENQMNARSTSAGKQIVYKLFTNHTIQMEWIFPPFESLLSADKYLAVDADIFMGMGFSRVLLIGETLRSNASTGDTVILGPLATLQEARDVILAWIRKLYRELADANGFENIPEPYLPPLTMADIKTLLQYASNALKDGAISLNTYAQMFGANFNNEQLQRDFEESIVGEIGIGPGEFSTEQKLEQQEKQQQQQRQGI